MKKLVVALCLLSILAVWGDAQELGVRFGDIVGNNVAVDAVLRFKGQRIHADVSFGDGVGIEVLFDPIVKPLEGEAFYFYVGIGAFSWLGDPFRLGLSGELGLEYRFNKVPIAIGVDWRPSLRLIDNTKFLADRFGFNVRWVF